MKEYNCSKCGSVDLFLNESGSQKGLYCSDCGSWIKWVGKKELPLVEKFIKKQPFLNLIFVVFYDGQPYKDGEGIKRYFTNREKVNNYRNNAIRNVARLLYLDEDSVLGNWYDIGEENKKEWLERADKLLEIKEFKEI